MTDDGMQLPPMQGPDPKIPHAPVAIVMRTKQRPVLLRRALSDTLRQSYQTWHLVLVNDGGDQAAVDGLVAEHEDDLAGRITVLHNEESRGKEPTSNQALRSSSSAYIAIHDDDDTWHPDFLARTVAYLEGCADAGVAVRTEIIWERVERGNIIEQGRNQDGSLGNSVISGADDHRRYDLLVRNAALQEHVRQHGMGGVLYLTKYIDRRMDEMLGMLHEQNDRSRGLEEAISDASLVSLLRRRYRRLKGRFVDGRREPALRENRQI